MDGRYLNLVVESDVPVGLFASRSSSRTGEIVEPHPSPTRTSGSTSPFRTGRRSRFSRYFLPAIAVVAALAFAVAAIAAPTDENQVIVPSGSAVKNPAPIGGAPGSGLFTLVAVLVLAGAGGWLVWRGRKGNFATLNRAARQLAIEETRSLGNRQYLVVASYQDKKFLLGVCPGRIDLLSPLHDGAAPAVPAKERA